MQRPVLIVFNPVSGRARGARFAESLAGALRERGREAELLETRAGADVFRTIDAGAFAALVVVGGDGSMNAAVNGLRGASVPLGFAGIGTVNVLTLEAHLAEQAADVAAEVVAGRTLEIPLLLANGRRWLLFAEAGFLGTVVRRVNRRRARSGRHGKLEFVASSLAVLPWAWGLPLRARFVAADGTRRERRYSNVLATRARNYAGRFQLPLDGVGLGTPHFQLIGLRTRTPFGHLLFLSLAALGLLPLARALLERLGLLECLPCVELEVEGPASAGAHADAESVFDGQELRLPLSVGPSGSSFLLVVP